MVRPVVLAIFCVTWLAASAFSADTKRKPRPCAREARQAAFANAETEEELGQAELLFFGDAARVNERFDKEAERELIVRAKAGDRESRDRLFHSQLFWVANVAKAFRGRGIEYEDLIQEGTLGLFTALRKFNVDRNIRFNTYATWWIKNAIRNALLQQTLFRAPAHLVAFERVWEEITRELTLQLSRAPDDDEVIARYVEQMKRGKIRTLRNWRALMLMKRVLNDFDVNPHGDGSQSITEYVADPHAILLDDPSEDVWEALEGLEPREREVIQRRFALWPPGHPNVDLDPQTLREIGDVLALTRERVRQIEVLAKNKLFRMISLLQYGEDPSDAPMPLPTPEAAPKKPTPAALAG